MQSSRLPIWRDSQQLLIDVEQAVRVFPRYHKYTIGSDLRRQAIHILRMLTRAINGKGQLRMRYVRQLVDAIDDIKFLITTARTLQAFASLNNINSPVRAQVNRVIVKQQGYLSGGLRERCVSQLVINPGVLLCMS